MRAFPVIDYASHPAFSGLKKNDRDLSPVLLPVFQELDVIINRFDQVESVYSTVEISDFYQKTVATFIDLQLKRRIREEYQYNAGAEEIMMTSFGGLLTKLMDQSLYKNVRKQNKFRGLTPKGQKVLADLNEKGISTSRIDQKFIDMINEDIVPYKNAILEMEKQNPFGRNYMDIPKRSRHWRLIEKAFHDSGFLQGASAFYGSDLYVTGCGLEMSTDKQTWWRDCYADKGISTVPCAYMHNDYDYDYVKSLVYLSEVGPQQGPFSYIPESHKWEREQSLSFYIKETEMNMNLYFKARNLGKPNYYRRAMGIEEGREVFYALPTLFQQLSHFGDDVMPNTSLSDELMSKEFRMTSEEGNFAFFTGGTGIHRGSNVSEGHRWAFQITLTKGQGLKKKITAASRRIIGESLKTLLGEQQMLQLQRKYKKTF